MLEVLSGREDLPPSPRLIPQRASFGSLQRGVPAVLWPIHRIMVRCLDSASIRHVPVKSEHEMLLLLQAFYKLCHCLRLLRSEARDSLGMGSFLSGIAFGEQVVDLGIGQLRALQRGTNLAGSVRTVTG